MATFRPTLIVFAALALCAGACGGGRLGEPTGAGGAAGIDLGGGAAGGDIGGVPPIACSGASNPSLVIAPQRMVLLTMRELVNSIRGMFGETIAAAIASSSTLPNLYDEQRKFPPAAGEQSVVDDSLQSALNAA